ncbi:hypothetical protein CEUSTIGMA_g2353.t1 [Chlamydomonas eustigma]|uniref:Mitochondrial inner membrane protease ATP23 n=1 Tax=Chlamydomonas eustigma TaxID=1157962 RepID=A0A250WVP9_9CHLO|nr:hypothetical protein CEUSTIGMA_g2353.t1 [Chlamydomonas eustigma]|eukprot:GAX74907.1 hypothetical protein CEUSTIGMA_g2353.t1 [Chlamydomonas eustigma]
MDWNLTKEAVEGQVTNVLNTCRTVKKLMEAMREAGCEVGRDYFKVVKCDTQTGGGFSIQHGVVLCYNQLQTNADVQSTMVHELLHAYDYCRNPNMDFADCKQHACSEIRAANLSGDCDMAQEFLRGHVQTLSPFSWAGMKERCVRRRAALSVAMNPRCGGREGAAKVVDGMYEKCMEDCAPFT